MIDIEILRNEPDRVKQAVANKGFSVDIDLLLTLDRERRHLQTEIDNLRASRNKLTSEEAKSKGPELKRQLAGLKERYRTVSAAFEAEFLRLPNLPSDDTPIGPGESANTVIRTIGAIPQLNNPKDHLELGIALDLIDIERATKVAGTRFNFLKNALVLVELALIRYAFESAIQHGFIPMLPPELVNRTAVIGTGYLPYGEEEVYHTQDDLYLIGTSELPMVAYHADEILAATDLPKRYVGFSTCFRREAGSYGKDTRGIFRQHQFMKVELVSLVKPEDSDQELANILAIEEEIMQGLKLPYRVVQIGTGDLGMQAAKKFDIEAWIPSQGTYRETHSCSNTTDFQTRRLNIRYQDGSGKPRFVHALNGTAVSQRPLIAIMENYQQPDGSIRLPDVLATLVGFDKIKR